MRRRTLSSFLLGISSAVLVASCGGGGAGSSTASTTERTSSRGAGGTGAKAPSREVRAAESTLASFFEDRAKEDWKAACSFLSSSIRSQLEELAKGIGGKAKGCASVLAMSSKGEAAVGLSSPLTHGQKYAMPMVREGGGWRPAEVAPVPDPSGGEP
jgi:hypothetical protein